MATVLVKPGLVKGPIVHKATSTGAGTATDIGRIGTDQDYWIKVMRLRFRAFSPDEEVTGDGDEQPKFENNMLTYGDLFLQGGMIANQAFGFKWLVSTSGGAATTGVPVKNPLGGATTPVLHTFRFGGGGSSEIERITGRFLVRSMEIMADRQRTYATVMMQLRMTDMTDVMMNAIESTSGG
jgi:hypothetical protein